MAESFHFDGTHLHDSLGDNMMVLPRSIVTAEGNTEYHVSFTHPVQPDLIASALHEPVAGITPQARYDDVAKGLRSLTYPNSRIIRQARRSVPSATEDYRQSIKTEVSFLGQRINEWAVHDLIEYRVKTPVYHHLLAARLEVEESLRAVKPLEFKALAARASIIVDDLQVRRMQKMRSAHRAVDIEDYVNGLSDDDHGGLVDALYGDTFAEVDVQDETGDKVTVIIPRSNLPHDFDNLQVQRATLSRELQPQSVVPEHKLALWYAPRPSALFVHLAWTRRLDGSRAFNVSSPTPRYEPVPGRLEFSSRVLGAALLVGHPEQTTVNHSKLLQKMYRPQKMAERAVYSRYLAGVLPLLLRHQENQVLAASSFITQAEAVMDRL